MYIVGIGFEETAEIIEPEEGILNSVALEGPPYQRIFFLLFKCISGRPLYFTQKRYVDVEDTEYFFRLPVDPAEIDGKEGQTEVSDTDSTDGEEQISDVSDEEMNAAVEEILEENQNQEEEPESEPDDS